MKLDIAGYTDTGLHRDHNEDFHDIHVPAADEQMEREGALFAVADGMGGHLAGEVASKIAIGTLVAEYLRTSEQGEEPGTALLMAVNVANRAVWDAGQNDTGRTGMGTTLVAAVVRPGELLIAHVGDSPAFLVKGDVAYRLTQDHSWVAEAMARGQLQKDEAEVHPYRHVLTRALGSLPEVEADLSTQTTFELGDAVVLCSDGLVRHVQEEEIPGLVHGRSAAEAAETLVKLANQRGGEDNTTVIVCKLLE
jgi:PPM family protein phosphatase